MSDISTVITDYGTIKVWIATNGDKSYKCEFTPEDAAALITILPQAIAEAKNKGKVQLQSALAKAEAHVANLRKTLEALP